MESSPQSNHPPIDARDAKVLADIDKTLDDYYQERRRAIDHQLSQGLVAKEVEVIAVEPI